MPTSTPILAESPNLEELRGAVFQEGASIELITSFLDPNDLANFLATSKAMAELDTGKWWKLHCKKYFPFLQESVFTDRIFKDIFFKIQQKINKAFDQSITSREFWSAQVARINSELPEAKKRVLYAIALSYGHDPSVMNGFINPPSDADILYCAALRLGKDIEESMALEATLLNSDLSTLVGLKERVLRYAATVDDWEIIQFFLNFKPEIVVSVAVLKEIFLEAVKANNPKVVRGLLSLKLSETPVIPADTREHAFFIAVESCCLSMVQTLLDLERSETLISAVAKGNALVFAAEQCSWYIVSSILASERPAALISVAAKERVLLLATDANRWKIIKAILASERLETPFSIKTKEKIFRKAIYNKTLHWDMVKIILASEQPGLAISLEYKEKALEKAIDNKNWHIIQKILVSEQPEAPIAAIYKEQVLVAAMKFNNWELVRLVLAFEHLGTPIFSEKTKGAVLLNAVQKNLDWELIQSILATESLGERIPEKSKENALDYLMQAQEIRWVRVKAILVSEQKNAFISLACKEKILSKAIECSKWDTVKIILTSEQPEAPIATQIKQNIVIAAAKNADWDLVKTVLATMSLQDKWGILLKASYAFDQPLVLNIVAVIFAGLPKAFRDTFKPYKSKYHAKRDAMQAINGFKNIIKGNILFGFGQFITSPLTLVFKIPLRLLLTAIKGAPKIEENQGLQALLVKANIVEGNVLVMNKVCIKLQQKFQKAIDRGQSTSIIFSEQSKILDRTLLSEVKIDASEYIALFSKNKSNS